MAPRDYYDDYYEPPRRRYRRRRRRGGVGLVIFLLILLLALFFVWRFTDGLTTFAGPDLKNVQNEFTYSLDSLAGEISPEMRVDECGLSYMTELEQLANSESELADRLRFHRRPSGDIQRGGGQDRARGRGEARFRAAHALPRRGRWRDERRHNRRGGRDTLPHTVRHTLGVPRLWQQRHGHNGLRPDLPLHGGDKGSRATRARRRRGSRTTPRARGHYVPGAGTAWTLFTDGAAALRAARDADNGRRGGHESSPAQRGDTRRQHAARGLYDERALHPDCRPRALRLQRLRPEQHRAEPPYLEL